MPTIIPTILSGGFGSRLWPLSRRGRPKQFLPIFDGESLFQKTVKRVQGQGYGPPLVISNEGHRFLIGEQLNELDVSPTAIVLEPMGRNTAAPAALAALMAVESDPDALVLLLPSDHLIQNEDLFRQAVEEGASAARSGQIITFGVAPSEPNTGYGYIRLDEGAGAVRRVDAFVEKPDLERAKAFLKAGNYVWNAGIFLYSAKAMIEAFRQHAPDTLERVSQSLQLARKDLDFLRLEDKSFGAIEDLSFDYAIMEKVTDVACVPVDPGWSDLGSWSAIWDTLDKNEDGNSAIGEAMFIDANNCLAYSDEPLVSIVGLDGVMVVCTKDAVLVASKDKAQDVKKIVQTLEKDGRPETREHRRVYRPWGWREQISRGDRFFVQSIEIKPGASQSRQSHLHRAEHWVVVSGTIEIEIDGKIRLLSENESVFVPLGARHRVSNPGHIPARLIEVQSGAYIGEEDIRRHEENAGSE